MLPGNAGFLTTLNSALASRGLEVPCEIKHNEPRSQYILHQARGVLELISRRPRVLRGVQY